MSAADLDMQQVLGAFLPEYLRQHRLHPRQRQICAHLRDCRTPALGGQRQACGHCAYERSQYHSCRDRHCPKCQGRAGTHWAQRQGESLLPVTYYHLVFTLPHQLNPWVQLYPRPLYDQLFASVWATLAAFAADPKRLGGQLGMSAVLHTWGQTLTQHVHLHCLIPGGVLTAAGHWRAARGLYLFPLRALAHRVRGHCVAGLRRRAQAGELARLAPTAIDTMLDTLMAIDWVVYAKPCLGEPTHVLTYLGRYTHRTALTDRRLLARRGEQIALHYTDYRDDHRRKVLWLDGVELLRRFLLHVLPKGLMRIRHYGLLANRCRRTRLARIRTVLMAPPQDGAHPDAPRPAADTRHAHRRDADPLTPCPRCHRGRMHVRTLIPPSRRRDSG